MGHLRRYILFLQKLGLILLMILGTLMCRGRAWKNRCCLYIIRNSFGIRRLGRPKRSELRCGIAAELYSANLAQPRHDVDDMALPPNRTCAGRTLGCIKPYP